MTIPIEEYYSLKKTKKLLMRLLKSNITEIRKDAKEIRQDAIHCLRHYPFQSHLIEIYKDRVDKQDLEHLKYDDE